MKKKLLVIYSSKVAISELVHSLKGTKSLLIRKKNYPTIRQKLWGKALLSPSYFAGSCGAVELIHTIPVWDSSIRKFAAI